MTQSPPDKRDMILAFGYETARAIIASDGQLASAELADLSARFPADDMEARGLLSGGQPTPRFGEAYNHALAKLRSLLSEDEKLQLAQAFFEICSADDVVEAAEVEIIVKALGALGVEKARLAQYLRGRSTPPG